MIRGTVLVVPDTKKYDSLWGAYKISRDGKEVEPFRESVPAALAFADGVKAATINVNFYSTRIDSEKFFTEGGSPLELAMAMESGPVSHGLPYTIHCRVGLPHDLGMWCSVSLDSEGQIIHYAKIGLSPWRNLLSGGQNEDLSSYSWLVNAARTNNWRVPDFQVRWDVEAREFVPEVMALYAKAMEPRPKPGIAIELTPEQEEKKRRNDRKRRQLRAREMNRKLAAPLAD